MLSKKPKQCYLQLSIQSLYCPSKRNENSFPYNSEMPEVVNYWEFQFSGRIREVCNWEHKTKSDYFEKQNLRSSKAQKKEEAIVAVKVQIGRVTLENIGNCATSISEFHLQLWNNLLTYYHIKKPIDVKTSSLVMYNAIKKAHAKLEASRARRT